MNDDGEYDLAAFVVGAVERAEILEEASRGVRGAVPAPWPGEVPEFGSRSVL